MSTSEPRGAAEPGLRSEARGTSDRATREGAAVKGGRGGGRGPEGERGNTVRVTRSRRNVAWTGTGALVDQYATTLYRVAFSVLRNQSDAEDAEYEKLAPQLYRGVVAIAACDLSTFALAEATLALACASLASKDDGSSRATIQPVARFARAKLAEPQRRMRP